ncbi:hypothetical protein J2W49_001024 [Hydrogenophaga palleronii]|uniref:Uncharacterized protein n=1 Tax=Hydrogenophaga palleronii TaxID=65655 RepID=A0ABU1WIH4_9BURK|nr:hypothetical protein [Hydrogenophaga palleronii]
MLKSLINRLPPAIRCRCTLGHLAWWVLLLVVFLTWGHLP